MSIDNLYDFFKKINYRRILPVLLCPVLLLCTSISVFAADFSAYNGYNVYYSTLESPNTSMLYISRYTNGVTTDLFNKVTSYVDGVHHVDNTTLQGANVVRLTHNGGEFYFPINNEIFDYYIVGVYQSVDANDSFWPNRCTLTCLDNSGNYFYPEYYFSASDAGIIPNNTNLLRGFSFYFKVDFSNFAGFSSIALNQTYNSNLVIGKNVNLGLSIVEIHKSATDDDVNSIITAINNQTTQQNNNFNNFMGSGSQFGGTTSGILSGNDELSGFIDDYTEVEQSMYDKFTENQTAVSGNFSGWSWGSLSTAVDWTSDYLNRIYDNSGDFRTMFMYPILAGIALVFIGRQGLTAYVRSRREK